MKCGAIKYDDKLLDKKEAASEKKEREKNGKKDKASRQKKFVIFIKPKHAIHYKPFDLFLNFLTKIY